MSAPDSIWNRSMQSRKALKPDDGEEEGGNEQQASGADIANKLDFDVEPKKSIQDKQPLSMMDVIYDLWRGSGRQKNKFKKDDVKYEID